MYVVSKQKENKMLLKLPSSIVARIGLCSWDLIKSGRHRRRYALQDLAELCHALDRAVDSSREWVLLLRRTVGQRVQMVERPRWPRWGDDCVSFSVTDSARMKKILTLLQSAPLAGESASGD